MTSRDLCHMLALFRKQTVIIKRKRCATLSNMLKIFKSIIHLWIKKKKKNHKKQNRVTSWFYHFFLMTSFYTKFIWTDSWHINLRPELYEMAELLYLIPHSLGHSCIMQSTGRHLKNSANSTRTGIFNGIHGKQTPICHHCSTANGRLAPVSSSGSVLQQQ